MNRKQEMIFHKNLAKQIVEELAVEIEGQLNGIKFSKSYLKPSIIKKTPLYMAEMDLGKLFNIVTSLKILEGNNSFSFLYRGEWISSEKRYEEIKEEYVSDIQQLKIEEKPVYKYCKTSVKALIECLQYITIDEE